IAPVYKALFEGVRERFGSASEAFLYYLGLNAGRSLYRNIVGLGMGGDLPTSVRLLALVHGRALFEFTEFSPDVRWAVIRSYWTFECTIAKTRGTPHSAFYRGFLERILSEAWGQVHVTERRCIAAGDDFCEFYIGPRTDLVSLQPSSGDYCF
ncbi:MAG: V4R domain-containing protein, partial [Nitrososphaerota archaeon]